jgi:hypothetical protein
MTETTMKIGRHTSHTIAAARKAGIILDSSYTDSNINIIEQEQADIT